MSKASADPAHSIASDIPRSNTLMDPVPDFRMVQFLSTRDVATRPVVRACFFGLAVRRSEPVDPDILPPFRLKKL
jgi:hypothetical protein